MKAITEYESHKGLVKRLMATCMMVLMVSAAIAQGFNQKYDIYLIGQVTNDLNGAPLKYHEVTIVSDTANEPGYYYYKKVYTDHNGYYYDTILTTLEKGALIINTLDHNDNLHDTVVHYRFTWSESAILFADFVLPAPPLTNFVQANFSYLRNPGGNGNMAYKFTDLTGNANILTWSWDFGDGSHSQEQNPTHIFAQPGLYKVELCVLIYTGLNNEPLQTKMVKMINVTAKSYFHMGGHVFAGYFPIDKSEVFLYKIEGDNFVPIDTAIFSETLGYFLFYQLIEGEYILKADLHPTSELFNMFMTTYYSDKLHWDEADTIFHYSTSFEYDINLMPTTQSAAAGPGSISGQISYDPSYGGGKSTPAENVSILLYDLDNQPVTICHSDEEGQFMLNQLDLQMYYVYAEVTGITTLPVEVILEENMNGAPIVNLVIDNQYVSGAVNSGISDNPLNSGLSNAFPNPVNNLLSLSFDGTHAESFSCQVLNSHGQKVLSSTGKTYAGSTIYQIDVSNLTRGIYFIRIQDQLGRTATRKFVKN